MAWLSGWGRDVSLTRQFGLLSLVVIGLITTTFCLVISHSLKQDLLEREWSTTADFIRTEAIHNLTPSDFAEPEQTASQARFLEFYLRTVVMPEIVRVKIYDAGKRVVWSDEPPGASPASDARWRAIRRSWRRRTKSCGPSSTSSWPASAWRPLERWWPRSPTVFATRSPTFVRARKSPCSTTGRRPCRRTVTET